MPIKISQMNPSPGAATTDYYEIDKAGVTYKQSWSQMLADVTGATVTSSTIDSTTIGATTPSSGVFSSLAARATNVNITTSGSIPTTGSLSQIYNVSGAGITLTFAAIAGYASGFNIAFVNTDGTNSFVVASSDLIAGQSSITVPPYGAILVERNYAGTSWNILADNSTQTGAYFQIANNLSESTDFDVLRNNIGVLDNFINIGVAGTTVLTNPCPNVILASPLSGFDVTVQFPVMNSTTPGSKSPAIGERFLIVNGSVPSTGGNITANYQDGSPIGISVHPGQWALLYLVANGSANGNILTFKFGTSYQMDASDTSFTSVLSAALNPNISWVGKLASFPDGSGSITSSTYAVGDFLLAANNLSDVNNDTTSINNLTLAQNYLSIVVNGDVALTNPCPTWIEVGGLVNTTLHINMPVMNSTTPGSKSPKDGQRWRIRNVSTANVIMQYNDGSAISGGTIYPGCYIEMVGWHNATTNGLFNVDVNKPNWGLSDGQVLIGRSNDSSVASTLTAGTGVSITNGSGSITINATGGGVNYVELSVASTITMAADTVYIINNAGGNILSIPTAPTVGTTFGVIGLTGTTGTFEIHQSDATQSIEWLNAATTIGTSGKIVSNDDYNQLYLTVIISTGLTTVLSVTNSMGTNFTIV